VAEAARVVVGTGSQQAAATTVESSNVLDTLVADAIGGVPGAREDLLAAVRPLVLQYCRARLGRHETGLISAEDVAQDVCAAVVRSLATYELSGRSFRAFVYGIAQHKIADTFRVLARNRTDPVAELPDLPVVGHGPEERLLDVEFGAWMGRLVGMLSPRQREVLLLRVVVKLSAEETADVVGSTPGAVRVTQHRALGRLREIIDTLPGGSPGRGSAIPVAG
jgi:RNA polymerase sigma-70 factor (ECF subfamily)